MMLLESPLSELLGGLVDDSSTYSSVRVNSIANDSREVTKGALFLAVPGIRTDGRQYIKQAIAQGASAIVYEPSDDVGTHSTVPCIPIANLKKIQSEIALRFFKNPSARLPVIGVTGTNGKTSTTQFIAQSFGDSLPCGVIGTMGYGFLPDLKKANNTTPDALSLQKMMAQLSDAGARALAMEVSSHGLAEDRVAGVQFHTAVFTNLSRDHLDFHGTMENYAEAKSKLFQKKNVKQAVINRDDPVGQTFVSRFQAQYDLITFSMDSHAKADIVLINTVPIQQGFRLTVKTPWGMGTFNSSLLGDFNIQNTLAVLGVLGLFGFSFDDIISRLSRLRSVVGRMETMHQAGLPTVVVDYAHTPDALYKVLTTLRSHCTGKLWCVFGCGGDRDRGKRPEMGAIAESLADQIMLTDDNPRSESSLQIVQDIMAGIRHQHCVQIECDRAQAIEKVIFSANEQDVILIAGKGHETEQIMGDRIIPFSDRQHAAHQLKSLAILRKG